MEQYTDKALELLSNYGLKVLAAVVILIVGRIATGIVTGTINRLMHRHNADLTLTKFVASLTKIALMTFVVIAAIRALGVETTSFVAVIGAAGLAIGFAMQNTLANFAAGVMLIIFKPFRAGDFIEGGGASGTVDAVQIFNTILRTPDNKEVIIPNSKMTGDNITNYSALEQRRIDMVFGIGYGDDIRKAKATLERILGEDGRVLKDPAPVVAVSELADSSINFVVRPWVKTADYWNVRFDITEKVKITFDAEEISIPFPQRDVHLFEEKAG